MSSKNAKSTQQSTPRKRKVIIVVAGITVLLIAADLTPLGGNIRFYAKWVECGQKPVQIQSLPGKAWYEESPTFMPLLRNQSWYCSPIEAERANYSAKRDYDDFPHLKAAGEPTPFERKVEEWKKR